MARNSNIRTHAIRQRQSVSTAVLHAIYSAVLTLTVIFLLIQSHSVWSEEHRTSTEKGASTAMCPPYTTQENYRKPVNVQTATPQNWVQTINNAAAGDEILLADGVYPLKQYAVVLDKPLTLRSASGNRDKVIIQGQGLSVNAEALMIMANDVHIADLTVEDVRDHAISIQETFSRAVIYNVHLKDIGTQHIKSNRGGPNGLIACSSIGYTNDTAVGDYTGAIDLHGAVNWTIRDNFIYNIWGDGSKCIVDADCGTQFFGGGPAILIWNNSRDNIIERNTIVESFRAIALGLDTSYSGGIVRDNFICRTQPGKQGVKKYIKGDAGISLRGADNVNVIGNHVLINGRYRGAIELKHSQNIRIENNVISKKIWNKGRSTYNDCKWWFCRDEGYGNDVVQTGSELSCPSVE